LIPPDRRRGGARLQLDDLLEFRVAQLRAILHQILREELVLRFVRRRELKEIVVDGPVGCDRVALHLLLRVFLERGSLAQREGRPHRRRDAIDRGGLVHDVGRRQHVLLARFLLRLILFAEELIDALHRRVADLRVLQLLRFVDRRLPIGELGVI
jgi:hypothetical protein